MGGRRDRPRGRVRDAEARTAAIQAVLPVGGVLVAIGWLLDDEIDPAIVTRIADAPGWGIVVTESDAGGARFEITGVDTVDTGDARRESRAESGEADESDKPASE